MSEFPFGNTEEEHNAFCDSMKCHRGKYCNPILGECVECEDAHVKKFGKTPSAFRAELRRNVMVSE